MIKLTYARKVRLFAAGIVVPIFVSGCGGILSGAGPSLGAITAETEDPAHYRLVDLSASNIVPYMRLPDAQAKSTISPTVAQSVRLVPGDVLKIMIADSVPEGAIFAPLALGGSTFEARIDSDGRISVPYLKRPAVSGLSLSQVEALIKKELKGTVADPQVIVTLAGDLSSSVLVAGAVKAPGRFSALQGPLTLLDAINMAGGPVLEPHLVSVVVRNGTVSNSYSYQEILSGANFQVQPRSEIILERARKRFVAMGAVNSPGLHDLPSQSPSLLEALGVVGGLKETSANPQGVFVFRMPDLGDESAMPEVFRLNMRDPAAIFLARKFLVRPEDAIYVTNAAVYEWQKIISPIVQVLVLGRAFGVPN